MMFQRAKSFIIRRKNTERDYELPESGHLARRPVTVITEDYINLRKTQQFITIKPTVNFDTLRGKCASMESINVNSSTLQRRAKVLSVDGLDTLTRRQTIQPQQQSEPARKPIVKKTPSFFARIGSKRKKKAENGDETKKNEEKNRRNSFVFMKITK